MRKGENHNHPGKGSMITVEAIRDRKDIQAIKKMLKDRPRDFALFVVGINTNLRASDLLQLTAGQVRGLKPLDEIQLKEKKTGKKRRITLNKACISAIQALLKSHNYHDTDPLFYGRGGKGTLTVPSVNRLVKSWCAVVNLQGNYGSHTLRKTWGYHQRVTFGRGLPELVQCFNHSSQQQTLAYLCIQPEEIKDIYANEL